MCCYLPACEHEPVLTIRDGCLPHLSTTYSKLLTGSGIGNLLLHSDTWCTYPGQSLLFCANLRAGSTPPLVLKRTKYVPITIVYRLYSLPNAVRVRRIADEDLMVQLSSTEILFDRTQLVYTALGSPKRVSRLENGHGKCQDWILVFCNDLVI